MAESVSKNTEMVIVTPDSTAYLRALVIDLTRQFKEEDTGFMEVPTILSRAKTLVNKKEYIVFFTNREDT